MQRVARAGLFAVWKPPDITSAGATNAIRLILMQGGVEPEPEAEGVTRRRYDHHRKRLKVGHGGTLDKFAEGVLVVGVGGACKELQEHLTATIKEYEVLCEVGRTTDTLDAGGTVTEEARWDHIRSSDVEQALEAFRGEIIQTPPLYSAKKFKGRRFSDIARETMATNAPITVFPKPNTVTIHCLKLLNFEPPYFSMSVTCSSGTYMRSLARDVGVALGSVGYVKGLIRRRQGEFTAHMALQRKDWTVERMAHAMEQVKNGGR